MKFLTIFVSVLLFSFGVTCAEPSYYLEKYNPIIISRNTSFNLENIDFILGTEVDGIIIKTIPPIDFGIIEYQNQAVSKNDIFTRKQMENLRLKVNTTERLSCEIEISYLAGDDFLNGRIILNSTESKEKPNCEDISVISYLNTEYEGRLLGKSTEKLKYYISTYPEKGTVILNSQNGVFKYYPNSQAGTDYFCYRVCNSYGNLSNEKTVYISIEEGKSSITDNNSAESVFSVEEGYIRTIGKNLFAPALSITKCDFLVNTMNILKFGELKNCKGAESVFSDFDRISSEAKGYVSYALSRKIIESTQSFNPCESITRAQACGIMQRLLNIEAELSYTSFDDETEINGSERADVYSLYSIGAILPKGNCIKPNSILTREDYAIMLERLYSLYPKRFN